MHLISSSDHYKHLSFMTLNVSMILLTLFQRQRLNALQKIRQKQVEPLMWLDLLYLIRRSIVIYDALKMFCEPIDCFFRVKISRKPDLFVFRKRKMQ